MAFLERRACYPEIPTPAGQIHRLRKIRLASREGLLSSASPNGGHSSMVESQIVILVVAGSSPVGHPIFSPAGSDALFAKR